MSRMVRALFCFVVLLFVASSAPAPTNPNPTVVFATLEVEGVQVATLKGCEAFGSESQVIEVQSANQQGQAVVTKVPGATNYLNLVCTRGFTTDTTFSLWRKQVEDGLISAARKNGAIVLRDATGNEVARYSFFNAWPSALKINAFDSGSSEPLTEKIEIVVERYQRQ